MLEQQPTRRSLPIESAWYSISVMGGVAGVLLMFAPESQMQTDTIEAGREALEKFPDAIANLLPSVLAVRAYEAWGVSPSVTIGTILLLSSAAIAGVTYLNQRRRQNRAD